MKIGLTGSTGVLGSLLKKENKIKPVSFKGDITNKNDVTKWIKSNNFDSIIHLAAIVPTVKVNQDKKYAYKVNFEGTKNIIDAVNSFSNKKIWFFFGSTSHVYKLGTKKKNEKHKPVPQNYYGKTKLLSEKYILKNCNLYTPCIGRIFSFTSKKQEKTFIIPSIISKFKSKKKKLNFVNVNHERDFIQTKDIVKAIVLLMKKRKSGIYNISSGEKVNIKSLIIYLNNKFKKKLFFNQSIKKTTLYGSNSKLLSIGWKKSKLNFFKYIKRNI